MKVQFIFLLLAFLAEVVGTVGGFGSSVFFVPLGNFYFDYRMVLGMTALFHLASNLSKVFLFKAGLNKFLLIHIGIPSVALVILGAFLSQWVATTYLELGLSAFLVLISLLFLIKKNLAFKASKSNAILGGAISGFAAGFLGTGGAIRGLTMAAFNLEKSVFVATSAFIDLFIDAARSVVYYQNGYISKEIMIYIPFLVVIGIGGTYLGKKLLDYIPQQRFKQFSLIMILLIGIISGIHALKN